MGPHRGVERRREDQSRQEQCWLPASSSELNGGLSKEQGWGREDKEKRESGGEISACLHAFLPGPACFIPLRSGTFELKLAFRKDFKFFGNFKSFGRLWEVLGTG